MDKSKFNIQEKIDYSMLTDKELVIAQEVETFLTSDTDTNLEADLATIATYYGDYSHQMTTEMEEDFLQIESDLKETLKAYRQNTLFRDTNDVQ